jgi:hypothetical protein
MNAWENFYVIVGSSAGALIGLQFVVMTLVAQIPQLRDAQRAGSAFASPNIVHFSSVLLLSAIQSAPWPTMSAVQTIWAVLGALGVVYTCIVVRRMRTAVLLLLFVGIHNAWDATTYHIYSTRHSGAERE